MDAREAKMIVQRMETDARKKYDGPPGFESSYVLGSMLSKIEFMLLSTNLKFKDFNEDGTYKLPHEKR